VVANATQQDEWQKEQFNFAVAVARFEHCHAHLTVCGPGASRRVTTTTRFLGRKLATRVIASLKIEKQATVF